MAKSILNLNNKKAKEFFLKSDSFSHIDLPLYFDFHKILASLNKNIGNTILSEVELKSAGKETNTNHILYGNKDGKYGWRKFQIINPLIYISLVNLLTEKNNWKFLQECFKKFSNIQYISCQSLPKNTINNKKHKAVQICQWINHVEKKSIELALEYKFLYNTDITDCYGSIYTHAISWALHTKATSKKQRRHNDLLGNQIDAHLQAMSNGQTNGIPQGSVLMDFIAEIILGYADDQLSEKLNKILKNKKYYILRYKDDYRIFVNDVSDGEIILKSLSEVLLELNFRINISKTFLCHDVISGSLKDGKIDSLQYEPIFKISSKKELSRQLLITQQMSKKFPNSGILTTRLRQILNNTKESFYKGQEKYLTAILIDIGYNNPVCFHIIAAIMTRYIVNMKHFDREILFKKVYNRICFLPNIGLLEIWMQRISIPFRWAFNWNEDLCKIVCGTSDNIIFSSSWVSKEKWKKILDSDIYIDRTALKKINPKINQKEIDVFFDYN